MFFILRTLLIYFYLFVRVRYLASKGRIFAVERGIAF